MTRFLYDSDALMAELTPPGTFTHYYAHGANPGADERTQPWPGGGQGW